MNRWFRWYRGTSENPKFRLAARNGGVTLVTVMAVWQVLLEDAAHEDHRGVCEKREDFIAAALDIPYTEDVQQALQGLEYVGLISVGIGAVTINNWAKWQYDQDVIDPTNSSRQKRFRDRKREQHGSVTPRNGDVTDRNCPDTDTDTDTERKKEISLPSEARPKPVRTPKPRKAYPDDFETFWRAYPTDPNMSKAEALAAWQRLGEEDRQQATASIPSFVAFCRKDPTYRPIHACRFLTKRRFEGHATGPPVQTMVYTLPPLKILTDAELEAQMLAREAEEDARNQRDELSARGADNRKVASA